MAKRASGLGVGAPRLMKSQIYEFTKEEKIIKFYRENPVEAARDLLKIELEWFQRKQLKAMWTKPRCLLKWGRGTSKTFIIAVYAVLRALLFSGQRIGVIGPTFRQTGFVFDEIEKVYSNSPYCRAAIAKVSFSSTKSYEIKFYHGSMVEGLPIGNDGAKIRGRRYNIVILDEYNYHDEATIGLVVRPFLMIKKGSAPNQIIMASTPGYKNEHFYTQYMLYRKEVERKPWMYSCTSYNFADILLNKKPVFEPDLELVSESFDTDPLARWLMEYGGFFPEETASFFSPMLINECSPRIGEIKVELKGDPNSQYIIGIDPAREEDGDRFAYCIIKLLPNNMREVVKVFAAQGVDFVKQMNLIRREIHLNGFTVIKLVLDYGGGGSALKDLLMQQWPHGSTVYPPIVEPKNVMDMNNFDPKDVLPILHVVKFTIPIIDEMYTGLKADMEHRRIKMPIAIRDFDPGIEMANKHIDMLKTEMIHVIPKATTQGLSFIAPKKPGKDRLTALCLANKGANQLYAEELGLVPEQQYEVPMGFWIK